MPPGGMPPGGMPYGQSWGSGGPARPYVAPPKRGGCGKALLAIVLSLVTTGLGLGAWLFFSPAGPDISSFGLGSSDFYEDASELKKTLKKTPGKKAKYLTLSIYPEYAIATVAPKSGTKAPSFMVRGGTSKQWTRMPMMTKPDDVDKAAFRLSDVDFEAIPVIANRAAADLEMPEGTITHMMLRRPLPFGTNLQWRVYLSSDGDSKNAVYTLQGKPVAGGGAKKLDYFKDASDVPGMLKKRFGDVVKIKRLVLYPAMVNAEVQDAKKATNIDDYTFRAGNVSPGRPQRLSSRDKRNISKVIFSLDKIDFASVPGLAKDAQKRIDLEDSEITHAIFEHGTPFRKELIIRFYVKNKRESGMVTYRFNGKFIRMHK
jgi:hypothetical protein